MVGSRAADQQQVATRLAVTAALEVLAGEVSALAEAGERPVVIACWQHVAYLDAPAGLLAGLAEDCDVVVACVGRPLLPMGIAHAQLEPDESLATEWSLTAITPSGGVQFVATDLGTTLPAMRVEDGRAFRWSLVDDAAGLGAGTSRLVRELGARLDPATAATLQSVVTRLMTASDDVTADDAGSAAVTSPLWTRLARRMDQTDDRRREHATVAPPMGGLTALSDWLTDAGPRSPALGMIVVHCDGAGVTASLRTEAHALGRMGDLVVDVPPDAAMLVMPGLVGDALQSRTAVVRDTVAGALGRDDVHALGAEVSAVEARLDLVGSLGRALVQLRTDAHAL